MADPHTVALTDLYAVLPDDPPELVRSLAQQRAPVAQQLLRDHQLNEPPGPRAQLVTLADVTPQRVRWLWPGRLPAGKVVTLDGDPALGKSTLAVTFAAHVSTGRPWPDGAVCPRGDVVILSAEDGMADTIRPRLDAAEGDPARCHCFTAVSTVDDQGEVTTRPPTLADVIQFHETIERTKARLLIVDVLMAYLPSRVNSHRDQDVRAALHRIAEVAETTGCTVLLLRHLNKSEAKSPIYRGGGSIGIVGAARAGYIVGHDPDDDTGETRVLACIKNNLAAEPQSLTYRLEATPDSDAARVVWGEASQHTAADLLRTANTADTGKARTKRNKATEWLRKYLTAQGRAKSADTKKAALAAGFTDRTIARARKALHVIITDEGYPRTTYWSLPNGGDASDPGHSDRGTTGTTETDQGKRPGTTGGSAGTTGGTPSEQPKHDKSKINTSSGANHATSHQTGTTAKRDTEAALALLTNELGATPIDDTTWRRLVAGYDH